MKIIVTNSKGGSGKSTLVLALSDVLVDAQVIDLDQQGTITIGSKYTNRHIPVKAEAISARHTIIDTPPYHGEELRSYFETADLILIPVKVSYPDLLATKAVIDDLRAVKMTEKGFIIFNEVRKPYNKTYQEIKELFFVNYKDVKKTTTELSNLIGFNRILSDPIHGQAKEEIQNLVKELHII
jgi:cellulose biosynthesis protein BcsQ